MESKKRDYSSIDELIETQNSRKDNLMQAIDLLEDHKHLQGHMSKVYNILISIQTNMDILRQEKAKSENILQQVDHYKALAEQLNAKISFIEDNIPNKYNKISNLNITNDVENMTLVDTTNTPQLSTRRQLEFVDTEIKYLTQTDFQNIPGYMRGRVTYDTLNSFVDKMNNCIEEKYTFLSMPKSSLKKRQDLDRYKIYKMQENVETKNKVFITQDDLKSALGGKIDKHTLNLLTMLRHTQRIKEVRDKEHVRYIVLRR